MADFFPSETVQRGADVYDLEWGPPIGQPSSEIDLDGFNEANGSTGMIVLHKGKIVYEKYFQGADANSRFASWSVAKSFTSTLLGVAEAEGLIRSIGDPVVRYVPELADTAYADVTIEQALQMSSGVEFDAGFAGHVLTCVALPPGPVFADCDAIRAKFGDVEGLLLSLDEQTSPPGTEWLYSDADSLVLGWVLQNATGQTPARYLSEKIWQPLGMEDDATWLLDRPGGMTLTNMALNARLRDYARFGLLVLNDGVIDGEQILPEGWIARATTPGKPYLQSVDPEKNGYQYQWWVVSAGEPASVLNGAYGAVGAMGQYIHVDPQHELVVVKTSFWPELTGPDVEKAATFTDALGAIVKALEYE